MPELPILIGAADSKPDAGSDSKSASNSRTQGVKLRTKRTAVVEIGVGRYRLTPHIRLATMQTAAFRPKAVIHVRTTAGTD